MFALDISAAIYFLKNLNVNFGYLQCKKKISIKKRSVQKSHLVLCYVFALERLCSMHLFNKIQNTYKVYLLCWLSVGLHYHKLHGQRQINDIYLIDILTVTSFISIYVYRTYSSHVKRSMYLTKALDIYFCSVTPSNDCKIEL